MKPYLGACSAPLEARVGSSENETFCHLNKPEHVEQLQTLTRSDRLRCFWHCLKMEIKQTAPSPSPACMTPSRHSLIPPLLHGGAAEEILQLIARLTHFLPVVLGLSGK